MGLAYLLDGCIESNIFRLKQAGLQTEQVSIFKKWFRDKMVFYSKDQVDWNEKSYVVEFTAPEGDCHINSLRVCLNLEKELVSGFSIRTDGEGDNHKYGVLHSFNLTNYRVIDYTYFKNRYCLMCKGLALPCEYLGVIIPKEFILEMIEKIIAPRFDDVNDPSIGRFFPLIVSYFYFDNKDEHWQECLRKDI